jgi:hypothetical protein
LNGVSGGAAEAAEPSGGGQLAGAGLAGLVAQHGRGLLGEGVGHAQQHREAVVQPPDRVEVVLLAVAGGRLDQQPGAVVGEGAADVGGRPGGVAHVVEAVEGRHQVVAVPGEGAGRGGLEADPVGDAGLGGGLAGPVDRPLVVVEPGEGRLRVGLGHDDGRGAVAAADVGDPRPRLELGLDPVQGRDPGLDQVGPVAWREEHLAAVEDLGVLLVPADPGAGAEGLGDARLALEAGQGELERAGQVHRAGRAERTGPGHGPVQAEAVAEHDHAGLYGRPQVLHELAHEGVELVLVDGQHGLLTRQGGPIASA